MSEETKWPEWRAQARIHADVLKEHVETAADYGEETSYRMEGMTDCPEMLDLDSIGNALKNILAHAERAKIQLTILRTLIPADTP
ncbi:hypothetical protein [Spirillospora sp. NPDC047279]|uniref:hypothetical protein n=1 Tax=Spirillospora sp. NPDC047279 TaxID=3155478 RepID=UPI0034022F4F